MKARHRKDNIYIIGVLIGEKKVNGGKMIYEENN